MMAGNISTAILLVSLLRSMSRLPLNIEPNVDCAVNGRGGMLSARGLGIVRNEPRGLPSRLLFAVLARSQNALSFSGGLLGGRIWMFLPMGSVVMLARVGSIANVPVRGPLPSFGVTGRGVDPDRVAGVIARLFSSGVRGVLGVSADALQAAFFLSSNLAICSSAVSSSVVSPSSSAFHGCQ